MNYLITGGTGFLGGHLVTKLLGNHETKIWLLTRGDKKSSDQRVHYVSWDGKSIPAIRPKINVVINLAGKGIADSRWSDSHKKMVLQSRIDSSKACVDFILKQKEKAAVFGSVSNGYAKSILRRIE